MKEMARYGMTLALICSVASASLAAVNGLTKSKIIAQAKIEEELSLKEVFPEAARFEPVYAGNDIAYYKALDTTDAFIGVAFKAFGKGYSSSVETMVAMSKEATIKAIKVLSQNETPGLGARVIEASFTRQFSDKAITQLDQVQAITGATISSHAVIDAVKKKAQEIKLLLP